MSRLGDIAEKMAGAKTANMGLVGWYEGSSGMYVAWADSGMAKERAGYNDVQEMFSHAEKRVRDGLERASNIAGVKIRTLKSKTYVTPHDRDRVMAVNQVALDFLNAEQLDAMVKIFGLRGGTP